MSKGLWYIWACWALILPGSVPKGLCTLFLFGYGFIGIAAEHVGRVLKSCFLLLLKIAIKLL